MKPLQPDVRLLGDIFEQEAGDRLEVAAHIVRAALLGFIRFEVEHHRQGLDDRRLSLLGAAQLLLGVKPLGIGAKVRVEQRLLVPCLALDLLRLFKEIHEHRDLRPQDDRVDRLEHIVDRAHRITPEQMLGFLVDRRQEDDRNALGLITVADDLGGLIAVHSGHVDVEQDDGELAFQQVPKGFLARPREHDFADVLEHRRDREQIALVIVDQKHARAIGSGAATGSSFARRATGISPTGPFIPHSAASSGIGRAAAADASRARATHTRISASSSSMSTGLAI